MPLIALAGKGGTGKTTLSSFLVKYLLINDKTPVLAIDADPNINLNELLGLEVTDTLGSIREKMKKGNVPSGMTKNIFMSVQLGQAVIEAKGYDLLVMGQPEGAGCYCAANNLLGAYIEQLTLNYPYIIMDNEAGMEHISRLTTRNVDILLIISDTSKRGIQTAFRINQLAKHLNIGVGKAYIIINKTKEALSDTMMNMIRSGGLELAGTIPEDNTVYQYDLIGRPIIEMPYNNNAAKAAFVIFDKIVN